MISHTLGTPQGHPLNYDVWQDMGQARSVSTSLQVFSYYGLLCGMLYQGLPHVWLITILTEVLTCGVCHVLYTLQKWRIRGRTLRSLYSPLHPSTHISLSI